MAVRPYTVFFAILFLNVILTSLGKHVIVKRELIPDDELDSDETLLANTINKRLEKRNVLLDASQTRVVSPGKIIDEEAENNGDPDGNDDGSSDVSGSGYQRDNVDDGSAETQSDSKESETEESEKSDAVENSESDAVAPEAAADGARETKRQFIAHPHSRYYSHPGYVYLKAPPIRQKTIVTTRIPRPPIMMSYRQFLNRLARQRAHGGYHSHYHLDDMDDDDYAEHEHEHEHEEGMFI